MIDLDCDTVSVSYGRKIASRINVPSLHRQGRNIAFRSQAQGGPVAPIPPGYVIDCGTAGVEEIAACI